MLGEEVYLMRLEEEFILQQIEREDAVEREVTAALSGEGLDGGHSADKKVDRKDTIPLLGEHRASCNGTGSSSANPSSKSSSSTSSSGGSGGAGFQQAAGSGYSATAGDDGDVSVPRNRLDEFAHHHHLTKTQVEGLFRVLGPHYSNPGRRAPLKDFVLTSLVVLSTANNYRELNESRLFKSRGWMHKTIHQFNRMVVDHLSGLIEWPSHEYARDTMRDFENMAGLPGVIGALDTCHMPITKAPVGQNSKLYSNPMLSHSIHLMAVADSRARFTYINVGRPGSFSDSRVLRMSSLHQVMEQDLASLFPPNSHLVADSAFPLTDQIMTPYSVGLPLTREQKHFNAKVYATRRPVELAFELLRGRWRRLKCLEMDEVSSMTSLVKCCCILHNICTSNAGYSEGLQPEDKEDLEVEYDGAQLLSALQKRDMLAMYINGETLTLNIQ